jgi:hypothetical protein
MINRAQIQRLIAEVLDNNSHYYWSDLDERESSPRAAARPAFARFPQSRSSDQANAPGKDRSLPCEAAAANHRFHPNALRRRVAENLFSLVPLQTHFRGDDHLIALRRESEGSSNNLFRSTEAVDRRRVDQINAALKRRANRTYRVPLIRAAPGQPTDRPGAARSARIEGRFLVWL